MRYHVIALALIAFVSLPEHIRDNVPDNTAVKKMSAP
jgi:hypothetical protein